MLPLGAQQFRETIGEPKRDKLRQSRLIAVRQIAAFMPAAKPLPGIFRFRRRRPAAPARDQFANAGIVRRPVTPGLGRLAHGGY
jgi:hypothetical protein